MSAPYKVVWSDEAVENVDSIVTYLEKHWSQREVNDFLDILQEQETILSYHPKAYPLSEKSGNYRQCVVTKQVTIFYKFEGEAIMIRYVFDNRQNQEKLDL